MVRKIFTFIIVVLFSSTVAFGQANSGSGSGKDAATVGAAVSMVMGAGLIYYGSPIVATNCWNAFAAAMCAFGVVVVAGGVLSLGQGAMQLTTAKGANTSQNQSGYKGIDLKGNDFELNLPDGRTLDNKQVQNLLNQGRKDLAKAGVKLNENGDITFPNGNTANMNDLSNGNSAAFGAAAGLSEKEVNDLKDKINKTGAQAVATVGKDVNMVAGGGGGGSAPGAEGVGSGSSFDMNSMFGKAKSKANLNRGVAGLSKMLGGQPIGVAQDDIFKMVSRKYENKKSESFFIEGDWGL
jgi:hypothetical protein